MGSGESTPDRELKDWRAGRNGRNSPYKGDSATVHLPLGHILNCDSIRI